MFVQRKHLRITTMVQGYVIPHGGMVEFITICALIDRQSCQISIRPNLSL